MADRPLRRGLIRRARTRETVIGTRRIVAEGLRQGPWEDLYHTALVVSWPRFLAALAAIFATLNLIFAALFWLGEGAIANARPGRFADLFFFSVETLSTTGYGDMHPQTFYGHCVATVEIFVSLVSTAAMTGLVFARFSRPRARLIFARHPVIVRHDGVSTLMVRVVNARESFIAEATAKLWMLGPLVSPEGRRFVGFRPMTLLRAENPAFGLSWTLFHAIDAASPLHGKSAQEVIAEEISFVLSLAGVDERTSQTVHARQVYAVDALRWGHEYVDMFSNVQDGALFVDFNQVHETQPAIS